MAGKAFITVKHYIILSRRRNNDLRASPSEHHSYSEIRIQEMGSEFRIFEEKKVFHVCFVSEIPFLKNTRLHKDLQITIDSESVHWIYCGRK